MSDDPRDKARRIILARRARFVAAAVAGVGIACGKDQAPPQPCLSAPPIEHDAMPPEPPPQPCLSVLLGFNDTLPEGGIDGGADASTDGAPRDAGSKNDAGPAVGPTARPMPCLTPVRPPPQKK
ncbi:MAG: hypothetical protein KF819_35945 [Labilithrix sp.]|nr:hypothetical protein [Labilithrix sp.]